MRLKKAKGFTLLEILIVLVILGVVAGLAIPVYTATVEKSRAQEALSALGGARDSAIRFHSQNGSYATVANNLSNLDFNPNTVQAGQTAHFTYAASNQGAATITITATRNATDGGDGASTVAINQAGTVTKTGAYA